MRHFFMPTKEYGGSTGALDGVWNDLSAAGPSSAVAADRSDRMSGTPSAMSGETTCRAVRLFVCMFFMANGRSRTISPCVRDQPDITIGAGVPPL